MAERGRRLGVQERLEATPAGRIAISVFVLVTLGCVLAANLPVAVAPQPLVAVTHPYVRATGLYQPWRVFAPQPRSEVLGLEARVRHADGQTTVWRPPRNGPLLGAYRDYRWRKYVEHAVGRRVEPAGDTWPRLWEPLARYAARQEQRPGTRPVRVTLVSRNDAIPALGRPVPSRTPPDRAYFTLALPPRR